MMNNMMFDIKKVKKTFGNTEETLVRALDDINLEIKKGEFAAIVGPSGAGKSTLLNIMSGFDSPDSGHVYLSGKEIDSMSGNELANFRRDHIGFIFQAYNLIPVLTIQENIEYVMVLQGIKKNERDRRVSEFLKDIGLEGKQKRFPAQLSGGEQQRVSVARAMVSKPDIIIADEPTANLDSKTGSGLMEMMQEFNSKYNTTFVFSTHNQLIMEKAKRLITIKDGKILSDEMQ